VVHGIVVLRCAEVATELPRLPRATGAHPYALRSTEDVALALHA
jgi:hypothetical protein